MIIKLKEDSAMDCLQVYATEAGKAAHPRKRHLNYSHQVSSWETEIRIIPI